MELGPTPTQDALALLITAAKPLFQDNVTHSEVAGEHEFLGNAIQPSLSSDTKCLKSSGLGAVSHSCSMGTCSFYPMRWVPLLWQPYYNHPILDFLNDGKELSSS